MSTETNAPVGPITLTPANGGGPPTAPGDGPADPDGGTFNIGIDPETLAAAAKLAEQSAATRATRDDDDSALPPISVVPAVVTTTAATTSTAALVAGPALGPAGLLFVAGGTVLVDVVAIVATRKRGENARGAAAKKNNPRATTTTRSTRTTSGRAAAGGRTTRGGSRSGMGARGGPGRRHGAGMEPLRKKLRDKHHGNKHGLNAHGQAVGSKAKKGAALLAAKKNATGGTGGGSTTRAALRRAGGAALRHTARGLGHVARAATPSRIRRGASRLWNSSPARGARRAARWCWNTRPAQAVRAALRRAARATYKHTIRRPAAAVWRGIRRLWKRIRPGRGTYMHLLRTAGIGALAVLTGIGSFLALFGWIRHRNGGRMGWHIIRAIWTRLMRRSRTRRDEARRAETITGHVDDPGHTDAAASADGTNDPDAADCTEAEAIGQRLLKQFVMMHTSEVTMDRVGAEYKGIGPAINSVAAGIGMAALNAQQAFPDLPPTIMARLKGLVGYLFGAASYAEDMYRQFTSIHEDDIGRYEKPIKGQKAEAGWNVVPVVQTDGIGITNRPSLFETEGRRIAGHYATVQPTTPVHVVVEFRGMGGTLIQIATAVQQIAQASYSRPVHAVVRSMLGNLAQHLFFCAQEAQSVGQAVIVWHNDRANRVLAAAASNSTSGATTGTKS